MTTEIIGSKLPAKNTLGQNGFQGASSDEPGQHTTSGFLPQSKVPNDKWQTRDVDATPIKTHPGLEARSADGLSGKVPNKIG